MPRILACTGHPEDWKRFLADPDKQSSTNEPPKYGRALVTFSASDGGDWRGRTREISNTLRTASAFKKCCYLKG